MSATEPLTITASAMELHRLVKLAEVGARVLETIDDAQTVSLRTSDQRIVQRITAELQEAWLAQ